MLKAAWCRYRLDFKFLAKTSREEMRVKDTYFVKLYDSNDPEIYGIGECALFKGLSADDVPEFETCLSDACTDPKAELPPMSAIRFGFETARADLCHNGRRIIYPGTWQAGESAIAINGLIWMGNKATMLHRIKEKIDKGFRILKLKIGGINFEDETDILRAIRSHFSERELELRLDANGSFNALNVMERLNQLSQYGIHSIEQPVKAGQTELMSYICEHSPIDIALDEELIGFRNDDEMNAILDNLRPQYIILKPSLCGGFERADKWIELANKHGIGWWATSALESNIGLNAIAQWVSVKNNKMVQGLGTGELYHNNIPSPLAMKGAKLVCRTDRQWEIPYLQWLN